METKWLWARFQADEDDYRPIKWPPPGPYWCTGFGEGYSVVVAYVRSEDQITEFWPEAEGIDVSECDEIVFTSRFPKPEWWSEERTVEDSLRARAFALYTPPFRFERGYIWDANDEMVADDNAGGGRSFTALRIRGWGRIQMLDNPAALQDEAGRLIAEALTAFWQLGPDPVQDVPSPAPAGSPAAGVGHTSPAAGVLSVPEDRVQEFKARWNHLMQGTDHRWETPIVRDADDGYELVEEAS